MSSEDGLSARKGPEHGVNVKPVERIWREPKRSKEVITGKGTIALLRACLSTMRMQTGWTGIEGIGELPTPYRAKLVKSGVGSTCLDCTALALSIWRWKRRRHLDRISTRFGKEAAVYVECVPRLRQWNNRRSLPCPEDSRFALGRDDGWSRKKPRHSVLQKQQRNLKQREYQYGIHSSAFENERRSLLLLLSSEFVKISALESLLS
ncbi:uncharacterized protein SPSC_04674 [Sporisorium scitamineum]|uniref:Uncharacterized protein n=1 Tax=Sporisorium scitamineum TaxID=49012 RepID=A0A127ZFG0_9BASI|nr:uncharacterized protein SPSC_04674 [Sporisorium scitamineum]